MTNKHRVLLLGGSHHDEQMQVTMEGLHYPQLMTKGSKEKLRR